MSEAFRKFMSPGIVAVAGTPSLAARVGAAALAVGLAFSGAGVAPAEAAPQPKRVEQSAPPAAKRVPMNDVTEELEAAQEAIQFYGNVGLRHGLDPVAFALSALVDHQVSGLDADKIVLPASMGKQVGGTLRLGSHDLQRWVGLVLRHGAQSGVNDAIAAYDAALKLEDGARRRPMTQKVLKHIAMLRDDHSVDAEILAREAVRVKPVLEKAGVDASDPATLYLASSFGPEKAKAFLAAAVSAPRKPAHEVLGVPSGALKEAWENGRPPTVAQFSETLTALVDVLKEGVEKQVELVSPRI